MGSILSTKYLGLELKTPCVLAPGPITGSIEQIQQFANAGAAAAVIPSIFEDQLEQQMKETDALYECRTNVPTDSLSYFEDMESYNRGPDAYVSYLERVKEATSIPIIASIGATSPGDWTQFARSLQNHGADAIELNIYFVPADPELTSRDVENIYLEIVSMIDSVVTIPVAVKMGPYFSALPGFAKRLQNAGANGLVLFNRYLEPDIDIETREIWPRLDLSRRGELRLALRWIAVLRNQLDLSLAATGGVHGMPEVVKSLLVGADAVMMASSLLERGPDHLAKMLDELKSWMHTKNIDSVEELKGQMKHNEDALETERNERGSYLHAVVSFTNRWRAEHDD